jgi:alpha-beta hydrolase superfamily lysophospholipase
VGPDAGPDALVLDSPFLDLRGSWFQRTVGTHVLDVVGPLRPLAPLSNEPSHYARHLLSPDGGAWAFDPRLKRPDGVPARVGWMRAVRRGHARVARGLAIACPVLVAHAASSGPNSPDNPRIGEQDTVLDVAQIAAAAPRLGSDVTLLEIDGGVHDLALSAEGPRRKYLEGVVAWLDGVL